MKKGLNILITTGIYPPAIGGPAQYAINLKDALEKIGHKVSISTYGIEKKLPSGIRHLFFFLKIIPSIINSDFCIALDTFSVGFPTVLAGRFFGKKVIIRTGGDFLWEQYIERTGDFVLFREFYKTKFSNFNFKDRFIFRITKWTLKSCFRLVFSTSWQRDIWKEPYNIDIFKTSIIENYYGKKMENQDYYQKNYIGFTRPLKWKNLEILKKSFFEAQKQRPEIFLDINNVSYEDGMNKIRNCFAIILVSLGDISPNLILDAIRFNKPFILTKETGLYDKLKDIAIFVNPQDPEDIKNKIIELTKKNVYDAQIKTIQNFNFTHSWQEIANEFLNIYEKVRN